MGIANASVSACRYCQFYRAEGRRGGHCHQLGVPVQGCWTSCSLALPPFAPLWKEPAYPILAQEQVAVEVVMDAPLEVVPVLVGGHPQGLRRSPLLAPE